MADDELTNKLTSELENELNDDNIQLIIEYIKKNASVDDVDVSNITYKKDEDGNYVLEFDGYEMTIPKEYTVSESVYVINNSFNIENEGSKINATPSTAATSNRNSNGNNSGVYNQFNIAIDLDTYVDVIDKLSECKTKLSEEISDGYEANSLEDKLLNYYNSNYGESYIKKLNNIKTINQELHEKVQTSLMYYMSIDQNLANNMDSIIDSIFSGEYQMSQLMYESNGDSTLSYDEYLQLMSDNENYFKEEKIKYIAEFMMKFQSFIDDYKAETFTKMVDNVLEMAFLQGKTVANSILDDEDYSTKLKEFKDEFAIKYMNRMGVKADSCPDYIPELYWNGTDESPTTDYDKALLHISFSYMNGTVTGIFDSILDSIVDTGEFDSRSKLGHIGRNLDDLAQVKSELERVISEESELRKEFSSLTGINSSSNELNEFVDSFSIDGKKYEIDYSSVDKAKLKDFIERYVGKMNSLKGTLYDKEVFETEALPPPLTRMLTNYNGTYEGIGPSVEASNYAFAIAFKWYYDIDDRTFDELMANEWTYYNELTGEIYFKQDENGNYILNQNDIYQKVFNEDGIDGICEILSYYYTNLRSDVDLCYDYFYYEENPDDDWQGISLMDAGGYIFDDHPEGNQFDGTIYDIDPYLRDENGDYLLNENGKKLRCIKPELIRKMLFNTNDEDRAIDVMTRKQAIRSVYNSLDSMTTEIKNNLAYLKNSEESVELYLAQKLDKSSIGAKGSSSYNYYMDEVKKVFKNAGYSESDINYMDEWQLEALAVMVKSNYETKTDNTFMKYVSGINSAPRGVYDDMIIQARAFNQAKNYVNTMTGAEYIWATLSSFFIGFGYGLGNFVGGISDVFNADGEISQAEYEQQFISQLLTSDYSIYKKWDDDDPATLQMLSTDYEGYGTKPTELTDSEFQQMLEYAIDNKIPRYELEHMLGILNDDEYAKYKGLANTKDIDKEFYATLADRWWVTGYSNVVYSVGNGFGNMVIPLVLNALSEFSPIFSLMAVGSTSTSTFGRTKEGLMQQGITDENKIFWNSLMHGLIEGAGEAIFGKVLETKWGKKILKNLKSFPKIGKLFSLTDDLLGKIDNIKFGSTLFKRLLKNDLEEIIEELGENAWGYVADGIFLGDWPTGSQILEESWATAWQTALTTPLLNAFSGEMNKTLKKTIQLANGMVVTVSLAEIQQCRGENGEIDANKLYNLLLDNHAISGTYEMPNAANKFNRMFGFDLVENVIVIDNNYVIKLKNGQTIECDARNDNVYQKMVDACPDLLIQTLNNNGNFIGSNRVGNLVKNLNPETIDKAIIAVSDSNTMLTLMDNLTPEQASRVLKYIRPSQASEQVLESYMKKMNLKSDGALIEDYSEYANNINEYIRDYNSRQTDPSKILPEIDFENNGMYNLYLTMLLGDLDYDMDWIVKQANQGFDDFEKMVQKKRTDITDDMINKWRSDYETLLALDPTQAQKFLENLTNEEIYENYRKYLLCNSIKTFVATTEMAKNGYYNIPIEEVLLKRFLARYSIWDGNQQKNFYIEQEKIVTSANGTDYTQYFPAADDFITDKGLIEYTKAISKVEENTVIEYAKSHGIDYQTDPIAAWGEYLKNNDVTVKGLIFQTIEEKGNNFKKFNGNIGPADQKNGYNADGTVSRGDPTDANGYNRSGGAYMAITNYETLAKKYPDYCKIDPNTGEFIITDYANFGKIALSGVPLDGGAYIIEYEAPITELSMPSINHGNMYLAWGVPGGKLQNGDYETVVTNSQVNVVDVMNDLDNGRVFEIDISLIKGKKSIKIKRKR